MRTWSVSGTAFASCTRLSSLSMRTRTSTRVTPSTIGGGGEPALERARHDGRNELLDGTAERGDLLDAARGDEAVLRGRRDPERLDLRRLHPVEVAHLELPLVVGDGAETLHERHCAPFPREFDDQPCESCH